MKAAPIRQALGVLEDAGYKPRLVDEEDFLFGLKPAETPYVWVPLSSHANASALAILDRYVSAGGKIILFSMGETPSPAIERLTRLIGLEVNGSAVLPQEMLLYWHGAALPGGDVLTEGSRVLLIQPGLNETVLATWGSQYPAIITTGKGALLNWPSNKHLTKSTSVMALSKIMPMIKPDSVVFSGSEAGHPAGLSALTHRKHGLAQTAKPEHKAKHQSASAVEPKYSHNPAIPVKKALIPLEPSTAKPNVVIPTVKAERKVALKPEPETVKTPSASPQSAAATSGLKTQPVQVHQSGSPSTGAKAAHRVATKAQAGHPSTDQKDDAESEVLDNILGNKPDPQKMTVPKPDDPLLKDKMDAAGQAEPSSESRQKHFSFLSPEGADSLSPEFDYGVYSYNLRILDDYNRRINDALETSRQLALDIPEDKVRNLLQEARQHKRKFEALYLGNQTQAGLDEFAQARKLTLQALALTSASPHVEGRAIWLDRGSIVDAGNAQELRKLMKKLRRAGINIVYFETLNAGFPIYPSAILKHNPMVQGWDPLKVAVEEGHKLGMEVHAWVWAFAVGNRRHNPLIGLPESYPGPILVEGGLMSEALRNQSGGLNVDDKQNEYWLDPASEKARGFLLKIYQEIVRNYDVDGLQLDYIRYPFQTSKTRMGFDPVGRDHFYRATGQSLDNSDDYTAKLWIAWKTYQVSSFVQQVSNTLRQIKPNLKISAAVFPMKRESRIVSIQQDWETWIDNGWVDTLSPMSYTADPHRLQGMFDYVQSSPQKQSLIYPGIALHRLDGGQLVQQLEALRQHGGMGATLFAGAHLDQEKIDTLSAGPYKNMDTIPPHHDVVKSLQVILEDYRQKFATLQAKGALTDLSDEQAKAITVPMARLHGTLTALSAFKSPLNMPVAQLTQAQRELTDLRSATGNWLQSEEQHPFRARYFSQKMLLLNELMAYLVDKNKGAVATFSPPVKAQPVAVKPAASPVTSSAKSVSNSASVETGKLPTVPD